MEKYTFSRPIDYEDTKGLTSIEFDLDGLSYSDSVKAERMAKKILGRKNAIAITWETNREYLLSLASIASKPKLPIEFFKELPLVDITNIKLLVQNFLLSGDLEEAEKDEESLLTE